MIKIYHHIGEGFKIAKGVKRFYPKKAKGKETEFDVETAKWSQQASQIASFIGLFSCLKRMTKSSELLFNSMMEEANGLVSRIEIIDETTKWCERELGTLTKAHEADYQFLTNMKKSTAYKYDTEHGLFTRDTMPTGYREQYAKCEEIPQLDLLDDSPLNADGQLADAGIQSYKQKYSDPYGIYYKWIASQNRRAARAIQKKKEKKKGKKKAVRFEPKKIQKSVRKVELKRNKFKFVGRAGGSKRKRKRKNTVAMKNLKKKKKKEEKEKKKELKKQQKILKKQSTTPGGSSKGEGGAESEEEEESSSSSSSDDESEYEEGEEEGEDLDGFGDAEDESGYYDEEGEWHYNEDWQTINEKEDEGVSVASAPPPPPGAPPVLNFKFKKSSTGGSTGGTSIFGAIQSGGFKLRKVTEQEKERPKNQRTDLLTSIRSFKSGKLKKAEDRKLGAKKSDQKRAPLNVAEILQQQMSMISQAGSDDDDDDDDDDDWDDDDDDDDDW